jgi:ribosomal-protein-serine acetyltransferase
MPTLAVTQSPARRFGEVDAGEISAPLLVSSRLILRNYQPADAEVVCQAIQETRSSLVRWVPDIAQHNSVGAVRTALSGLARNIGRGDCDVFGIWDRATHRFLGEAGVYTVDRGTRTGEVGYWLRQTAQGRGYAQEAVEHVLEYASRELGLRQFEAHIAIDNAPSLRLAERLGFDMAGRRAPAPRWDGHVEDVIIYRLHQSDV